jgi:putative restriction endonuclease
MEKNIVHKNLTYEQAMEKVMIDNGGFAPLKLIYENIEKYRKNTGKTPDRTIQERAQRCFIRIAKGVYCTEEFATKLEKENIGYLEIISRNDVVFKPIKIIQETEKISPQKIRIGQNNFRDKLINELKECPITHINDTKLLIASHIKPWALSNNEERLDINNGFLLSPLYDKLFDKSVGLITFTDKREILLSKQLKNNINKIGVVHKQIIEDLPVNGREEFLEYHRKYIFQG